MNTKELIKKFFKLFEFQKTDNMLLGRWDLKTDTMKYYEGKTYPY